MADPASIILNVLRPVLGGLIKTFAPSTAQDFRSISYALILIISAAILFVQLDYRKTIESREALDEFQNETNQSLKYIVDTINSRTDGYIVPINVNFANREAELYFRLPLNQLQSTELIEQHQIINMGIFVDDAIGGMRRIVSQNLIVSINERRIESIIRYVGNLKSVSSDYFDTSAIADFQTSGYIYDVFIRLRDGITEDEFSKIKQSNIYILFTHRGPMIKVRSNDDGQ